MRTRCEDVLRMCLENVDQDQDRCVEDTDSIEDEH